MMNYNEFKRELIEELRYQYEDHFEWEERHDHQEMPGYKFLYLIANDEDEYLIAMHHPIEERYKICEEGFSQLIRDYPEMKDFIEYDGKDSFGGDSPTLGL